MLKKLNMLKFAPMEFSSKLLQNAVNEMAQLSGIGKRTALRLVLHLLRQPTDQTKHLSAALLSLRDDIKYCKNCHNISDVDLCEICANSNRNGSLVCVVEDIRDVMAIESTSSFKGLYHVLGGIISPVEGIGPDQLQIDSLIQRVQEGQAQEIIFALSATIEGDTTAFYITKKIKGCAVKASSIARGVAVGGDSVKS